MSLLAAYSFDEAGDLVVDYSGNGQDFTIAGTGAVRTAAGHTAGGLATSAGSAVQPQLPDIGRTANRTVMLWEHNLDNVAADHWPIIWNVTSLDSGGWGLLRLGTQIQCRGRNAGGVAAASATLPADDDWHHLAGTYDGSTLRLYIDAVEAATAALAGPLRTDTAPPQLLGVTSVYQIDDLRIYDEAVDQAAIGTLMSTPVAASGTVYDRSGGAAAVAAGAGTRSLLLARTGSAAAEVAGTGSSVVGQGEPLVGPVRVSAVQSRTSRVLGVRVNPLSG